MVDATEAEQTVRVRAVHDADEVPLHRRYQGNDTVRGWRDYDSIYHAVFACMRGSHGYPKGRAYSTVPEGLLLRPAIPSSEVFGESQHLRAAGELQDLAAGTAR